jgi:hypothetical protein
MILLNTSECFLPLRRSCKLLMPAYRRHLAHNCVSLLLSSQLTLSEVRLPSGFGDRQHLHGGTLEVAPGASHKLSCVGELLSQSFGECWD